MGNRGGPQLQTPIPMTPTVKVLIFLNVGIWFVFQLILENIVLKSDVITSIFGLVPERVITNYFIWQPFTYMFLHSADAVMHVVFNMLLLWWIGAELEQLWGRRFFLTYYLVCGVGAGIIYTVAALIFYMATGRVQPLLMPVVGASGAIFGLMLAYGIVFGERIVYFFFVFPMKARYFIMIIGGIEVVMLLNQGIGGGQVANMAHLGGLITGFIFLVLWTRLKRGKSSKGRGNLRLVVDNDKPKYWN